MKKSLWVSVLVVVVVLLGIWYIASNKETAYAPVVKTDDVSTSTEVTPSTTAGIKGSPSQTNTGLSSAPILLKVSKDATLGNYLVASNGMTLYLYTKDSIGVSNCTGSCATNWPPYIVDTKEPLMADTMVTGKLATITRADGTTQLTYNGVPVYFWVNDSKAGDTTGQNVGGVWFVVKP